NAIPSSRAQRGICFCLSVLTAVLAWASTAAAQTVIEDTVLLAGRRVVVWHPRTAPSPLPAVVFSHGLGGCPTQSRFLSEGLAERGYYVLAPFHRDAGCGSKTDATKALARPPVPFAEPARWTDVTFADRA